MLAQLTFWVGEAVQSQLIGPLLVALVARELGPVLINLVVIVRSGSAMTTELGVLKINGEVRVREAQGSDPFLPLVMPRVLGTAVSTFCLTIVFILVAFASGYLFAAWTGKGSRDLLLLADTVSSAVHPKDAALSDEAQKLLMRANQAMSELQGVVTNLNVAVKNVQNGTVRLPEITSAVADEA